MLQPIRELLLSVTLFTLIGRPSLKKIWGIDHLHALDKVELVVSIKAGRVNPVLRSSGTKNSGRITFKNLSCERGIPLVRHCETAPGVTSQSEATFVVPPSWSIILLSSIARTLAH